MAGTIRNFASLFLRRILQENAGCDKLYVDYSDSLHQFTAVVALEDE
jgi:hypothetical protein